MKKIITLPLTAFILSLLLTSLESKAQQPEVDKLHLQSFSGTQQKFRLRYFPEWKNRLP